MMSVAKSKTETLFLIPSDDNRKTFDEDQKLPCLPVPDISHTLTRYLNSLKPFVTKEEYEATRKIVELFATGIGKTLHDKLITKSQNERNWIEKWWEDRMYLQVRNPLIFSSMNGCLPKDLCRWTYGAEADQIKHASAFAYHVTQFWNLLRLERLLPTQTADKKTNFSMSQYRRLFNTTRIPGETKDSLMSTFKTAEEGQCSTMVVTLCRGRLFCVNALDEKGNLLSARTWEEIIKKILKICDESESDEKFSIGFLTCDFRTNWSKNRKYLERLSMKNKDIFDLIDKSIFILILDDDSPESDSDVINCNFRGNYANRWIDKSVCAIFYKNGRAGTISDHAAFDGMVAITLLHFVITAIEDSVLESENSKDGESKCPDLLELKFDTDETIGSEILRVIEDSAKFKEDILLERLVFDDYGKLEIQRLKYHPDSFVQMCVQLAYVMLHGKPAPCYKTATTRKFYNGRTETLRSCTTESMEWVESMLNARRSDEERKVLLDVAIKRHDELMTEARENQGCDRHLFGLYCMALEEGLEIPEIFLDPSYLKSGGGGNFILSTSCTGYTPLGGGVTPMCENGYGVFYNILPDSIHFTVSVNKRSKETCPKRYFECVKKSFRRMREVILSTRKNSSKL